MFMSFNGEFTNETLGVKMIKCDHSRYDVRPVNFINRISDWWTWLNPTPLLISKVN